MPEDPPEVTLPEGPVRYAWFGGLLDGRRGDDGRLRAAVERGNRLGLAHLHLDLDGGRFSLLFDEHAVRGDRLSSERSEELVDVLNEVVASSSDPAGVESTLRCTEVYDDAAVDTLFTPAGGGVECVSRPRALGADDRRMAPADAAAVPRLPRVGRRQALGLLALVLVAFGLLAWKEGLVDRIAARSGESLAIETGPFGRALAVEAVSRWGTYRVTLRRGEDWPADAAAAERAIAGAETVTRRAAVRAVVDGGEVWVRLETDDGGVLDAAEVDLAPLLREGERDPSVEVRLPGQWGAHSLVLALDSGRKGR